MGGTFLLDTAHLVNSMRTRSALVSMTMVLSFTLQMVPTIPPIVVMTTPTYSESRRVRAYFFT